MLKAPRGAEPEIAVKCAYLSGSWSNDVDRVEWWYTGPAKRLRHGQCCLPKQAAYADRPSDTATGDRTESSSTSGSQRPA